MSRTIFFIRQKNHGVGSTDHFGSCKGLRLPPLGELGTVPMIHFPKEMVSRSEKFGVPVFHFPK